MSQKGK